MLYQNEQALRYSEALLEAGFNVPAIRPPTVPKNQARLRVSLNATHETQAIERLVETLIMIKRRYQLD